MAFCLIMSEHSGYLQSLFSLRGRTALVTGGGSGIGQGIATALARAGACVVLLSRDAARLEAVAAELRSDGCDVAHVSADLAEVDALEAIVGQAVKPFGEPDILVTAAANNIRKPMGELTADDWQATLSLNLHVPSMLGQRFGPGMAERGWGRIINIGSQQSISAFGNSGAYGVAKAGITGLSRSQAEAWSHYGVTCNTLMPGFVGTRLTEPIMNDPVRGAAMVARTMVGRIGEADDFAGAAVFLASAAGAYVTGQAIFVDGGFSVH